MEQQQTEDSQRPRVAGTQGIQPLHLEGLAAHGQGPVPERILRRSRRHLFLYEPTLPDAAVDERTGTGLACQMLYGTGMEIRRRGRDPQHEPRLDGLPRCQGLGLHLCQLLHPTGRLREGHTLSEKSDQARTPQHPARQGVVPDGTDPEPDRQPRRGLPRLREGARLSSALRTGV